MLKGIDFDPVKALSVLLSFSGIAIIALSDTQGQDSKGQDDTFKGNLLSLLSATFYGLYAVILKKRVPEEEESDFKFSYFLGFVGLFNAVCLIPVFPILNVADIEKFEWPNKTATEGMLLNAVLGTVISDYCWAKSVVLLGPLLTTLGIALTIPISMIVDGFSNKKHFTWQYFLGSVLILGSFFTISYLDYRNKRREKQETRSEREA